MSYIQPKNDYKDGDILYGIDLNASNDVIKAGVDDNFDRIQGLESTKQDTLTAGTGIEITEDNVINNTQTSAEWGNIQGDILDQTDLQDALGNKVDKEEGKGLSSEDYTNSEKIKLDNIESGAEVNVIDTIKVDGTAITPDNKAVDIDLSGKQETLVSGTNIKTINNQSILGSGNISVGGGSGGTSDYDELDNRPQINNVTLTGNKSLSDLGINIPTKISDLTNDNNTVTDASYVHTDNNYTSTEKTKLSNIESGAEVNDIDTIKVNGTSQTITNKAVDITVPTKISDLTNDNNTVTDASYVHTDNNYTSSEKTKLSGIEAGAQVNVDEIIVADSSSITQDTKLYIEEADFQVEEVNDIYSTDEIKTNKIWIDSKPIYRKVIVLTTPILLNASWQSVLDVSGMNISAITKLETLNNNDIAWNGTISKISGNNLQLYYIGVGGAEWYVKTIILEYTKGGNS